MKLDDLATEFYHALMRDLMKYRELNSRRIEQEGGVVSAKEALEELFGFRNPERNDKYRELRELIVKIRHKLELVNDIGGFPLAEKICIKYEMFDNERLEAREKEATKDEPKLERFPLLHLSGAFDALADDVISGWRH